MDSVIYEQNNQIWQKSLWGMLVRALLVGGWICAMSVKCEQEMTTYNILSALEEECDDKQKKRKFREQ